jgi:alanine racemase
MGFRQTRKPRAFLPACVPDEVKTTGVLWEPDETEILLANAQVRQRLLEQEVKLAHQAEQRAWLTTAMQRMAAIAVEIDEGLRRAALQEEIERNERWWADLHEKEKAANEKLMVHFQNELDNNLHAKMVARSKAAADDIRKSNARIERNELRRRGVLRGRRTS